MPNDHYLYCVAFPSSKKPGYLWVEFVEASRARANAKATGPGRTGFVLTYPEAECPVVGQYLHFGMLEAAGLL